MPVPTLPTPTSHDPSIDVAAAMRAAMAPKDLGVGLSSPATIVAPGRGPFFLRHHRKNWLVSTTLEKPAYLPEVTLFKITPGANGCRTRDKDEQADAGYRQAVRNELDKGWTFLDPTRAIPANCLPAGIPAGGYLRALPARHPVTNQEVTVHVEAWNVPVPGAGERTEFAFDRAAHERWLLWLVESGQIAPPTAGEVRHLVATAEQHHMNRELAAYATPEVGRMFRDPAKKRLEDAKAAVLPKPKPAKAAAEARA